MNVNKWLFENTSSLKGKTVALTGSTGGLGKELCKDLASLGADLILIDRNAERSRTLGKELEQQYKVNVSYLSADLEKLDSVKEATEHLLESELDFFIHNAGAYDIPRHKTEQGYDNVFQINFVSPYYIIKQLLPKLSQRGGKAVAVGSIAHNYSKIDLNDLDFSTRKAASKVYGNAKRHLMFSLFELFENEKSASLSIVHPGISFTGITNHYPKLIFAIIKHPMKVIFMKPKKACLSIVKGLFDSTDKNEWIGPRFFNVWGKPKKQKLKTCSAEESKEIGARAEKIFSKL